MGSSTPGEECALTAAKAYPSDAGRGIARVDPETLQELSLSPGDTVEVEGSRTTVATVRGSDRDDWNADIVRLDGVTRQNAGVDLEAEVRLRPASVSRADRVVLAPPEHADPELGRDAAAAVERQLLERPLVEGDVVTARESPDAPFIRGPGTAIPLVVVETVPDGPVSIAEDTAVDVSG